MVMRRIRLTDPPQADGLVTFVPPESHYAARVLRLREGDEVAAFDGHGGEWHVRLIAVAPDRVRGELIAAVTNTGSSQLPLILGQALPNKSSKMDLIVEKGSELGLTTLAPLYTERTVVREALGRTETKLSRWCRIAEAAARQCGRRVLLDIQPPQSLSDFCAVHQSALTKIICWEEESHHGIRDVLEAPMPSGAVAVLVGPEGGWTEQEVAQALAHGFVTVSLGPRMLRTETAAITLIGLIRYAQGELGPLGQRG
jgi:16S rRNA (uracil1498-N3)-methyltransferase